MVENRASRTQVSWIEQVWRDARLLDVLSGGEVGGPLDEREVLASVHDPEALLRFRDLTTSGAFTGDICRCPGWLTLALRGVDGTILGVGSLHDGRRISWNRGVFRNDLVIADPAGLFIGLAGLGVRGQTRAVLGQLLDAFSLHEGATQFRPSVPGRRGHDALAARGIPQALWDDLGVVTGDQAGQLDQAAVLQLGRKLEKNQPDPVERVRSLLTWLGSVTWPAEALAGEGVLVRNLLKLPGNSDVVGAAIAGGLDDSMLMGAVAWGVFLEDDTEVAGLIGEAVGRRLRELR